MPGPPCPGSGSLFLATDAWNPIGPRDHITSVGQTLETTLAEIRSELNSVRHELAAVQKREAMNTPPTQAVAGRIGPATQTDVTRDVA